jgi:hypothetical protein
MELASLGDDYANKAQEYFASAFEKYQDVIDSYSDGEFADTAARNYMTAIYQRLNFKGISEDFDQVKQELLEKIESIKDISIQADPKFANSKVASLFSEYGIEFKTAQQRLEEKYDELKVKFAASQSLSGSQRQQQLLSLLEDFNDLERPENEQFYTNLVNYIYEMFRDDWLAIYESGIDSEKLDVFSTQIASDTAEDEVYETEDTGVSDPNS